MATVEHLTLKQVTDLVAVVRSHTPVPGDARRCVCCERWPCPHRQTAMHELTEHGDLIALWTTHPTSRP